MSFHEIFAAARGSQYKMNNNQTAELLVISGYQVQVDTRGNNLKRASHKLLRQT